jgi:amphi-Trp domain-containing protein
MGKEVVLFASEEHVSAQQVSDFLRQLADKVDAGEVTLSKGSESLTLNLPQNLVLEVKAEEEEKSKGTKRSLEVEIEWMEGEDEGPLTLG